MNNFTDSEVTMLVDLGYFPAFMRDLRAGDRVAIAPMHLIRGREDVKMLNVQRVLELCEDLHDIGNPRFIKHSVVVFIGVNNNNIPEHHSYGNTYPCFIKREDLPT